MKKLDIMIQIVIVFLALLFVPMLIVDEGTLMIVLLWQMVIGAYQLFSALIRSIFRVHVQLTARKLLLYYWVAAAASIATIIITTPLSSGINILGVVIVMIIPWCIAAFYLYISWLDTYGDDEKRSKFLPNIHI